MSPTRFSSFSITLSFTSSVVTTPSGPSLPLAERCELNDFPFFALVPPRLHFPPISFIFLPGIQRRWFIEEIDRAFEKVEKESAKKGGKASLLKEYLAAINVDRTRFLAENPSFNNTKPAFLVSDLEVEGLYRAEKGAAERLMPLVEPELSSLAPGELWEDRVFETPLAFDESFAFSAREVGPCPAGFSSFQRSFIVGSEIWCFNPAANRMEFFDPGLPF